MVRYIYVLALALTLLGGCKRKENMAAEQAEEQQKLTNEHREERQDLAQDQAKEQQRLNERQQEQRADVAQDAQRDLRGDMRDVNEERRDLGKSLEEARARVATACSGVPPQTVATCPLDATKVRQVRDIDDGVEISLRPAAGSEKEVEQRLSCYQARAEVQRAGTSNTGAAVASSCLFDRPNVSIDVEEQRGTVNVKVTTDDAGRVAEVRSDARKLSEGAHRSKS